MRFAPHISPQTHAALALAGLGLTALAAAPAQAQGLNGQPVTVTERYPNTSTTYRNLGTQTITPTGATFPAPDQFALNVFVTPTQIQFTEPGPAGSTLTFGDPSGFNGYEVSETGASPVPITGFLVDSATNMAGFDLSRVSGDPADIFANFQGLRINAGQNVTLDINPPAVPEASTTASFGLLLALGLGGLVVAAKRRKANGEA